MANHQNFFSTNLTSGTGVGVTTTPLNSIPTCDAPFYLTLDATGINGHAEVIYVTSKTATNVNHAATTYAHTTAEEVRMDVTAGELDALYNTKGPQGHLVNGKIVPSVASNNLTVAIKGLDGNDPSATNPVYCRIGDTVRTITAALSVTKNAGTNWFGAGGAIYATKEIDYFVYLGYNATDGVVIGFSRIVGEEYDSFSATTTNEKYCAISTISNAAAGDDYELIGRFAATLSATANFYWSVPTFTNKNLIQRPIWETRNLSCELAITSQGGTPTTVTQAINYRIIRDTIRLELSIAVGNKGTATGALLLVYPFTPANLYFSGSCVEINATGVIGNVYTTAAQGKLIMTKYDNGTFWVDGYGIEGSVIFSI